MIEQPRPFASTVAISGLPDFRNPIAINGALPIIGNRLGNAVKLECSRFRRVLENAAKRANGTQCSRETTVIVVNAPTPTLVINRAELVPSVAWRVRHDRIRTRVAPRIAFLIPWVDIG